MKLKTKLDRTMKVHTSTVSVCLGLELANNLQSVKSSESVSITPDSAPASPAPCPGCELFLPLLCLLISALTFSFQPLACTGKLPA